MKLFLRRALLAALMLAPLPALADGQKIILDTDFSTTGDDGQVLIMAAQLFGQKKIELLGITTVTGNNWLKQETAEAVRATERLGIADKVGVYAGANLPLVHDPESFESEKTLFGFGESWETAFHRPQPTDDNLVAPPDGFAKTTKVRDETASEFIVKTVKANPGEVSLLVIGPVTNIALAVRTHPEIVPMIKQIVYMGGAFDVRGNTTPAAEMNIWIDPEAARIVMREPIPQAIIPLDVTNITQLTKPDYDKIEAAGGPVAEMFKESWMGKGFAKDPNAAYSVFDTLALAYLVDPSFAKTVEDAAVDVDVAYGPGYGRTYAYWQEQPTKLLQKIKVVKVFDTRKFFDFYTDLLSRPIPVKFD